MNTILIRGGRIIDPSQGLDRVGNVLIEGGRIAGIDVPITGASRTIDAQGRIVCPGLIDLHVNLREPGNEEDETIASGTAAAVAGGFTTVACMPDTACVVDNRSEAEFILVQGERAGQCHVYPLGAVTKGTLGVELAEIGQLVEAGVRGFTDGRRPIANPEIMRRALEYTRMFDRPVLNRPNVPELTAGGVMHEGFVSTRLGLRGMPAAAEEIMVSRDIALAELTGGRVHLLCLSTARGAELVRRAKERGLRITSEVAVHQLALTDDCLASFGAEFKVDPPLRSAEHRDALLAGLQDDTIDAIVSDHQPHAPEKKQRELDQIPFGIMGLETVIPVCIRTLIEPGVLSWSKLIEKLTIGPARVLGLPKGTLRPGADADVTVIDPQAAWTIDPAKFKSKSRNTPFAGWEVRGRAETVIVGGRVMLR